MELIPEKNSTGLQISAEKYSLDQVPPPPKNGSVIALAVATIPIIILILILVSFKICEKVCPSGQRRDIQFLPRRISTMSTFSTTISRKSSSAQIGQTSSHSGSSSHLNLHHVHPLHHPQHVTTRADGTPLLITELETIRDQDEEEEEFLTVHVEG